MGKCRRRMTVVPAQIRRLDQPGYSGHSMSSTSAGTGGFRYGVRIWAEAEGKDGIWQMGTLIAIVAVPVLYGVWRFLKNALDNDIEARWNQEAPSTGGP